jgi:O-methyltransferase
MGKQTLELNDELYRMMQVSADQAQFMALMLKLINARRVLEIGTFTGYSALVMADALPNGGEIIACDKSEEWTNMGKGYWRQAGLDHKINLRLAPALDTLKQLVDDAQQNTFDAAFIDADKTNILNYYEYCLTLVRPGGLIMIDNVLWGGSVIDPGKQDDDTNAIREANSFVFQDERVDMSLVPIGDGLTLARKK